MRHPDPLGATLSSCLPDWPPFGIPGGGAGMRGTAPTGPPPPRTHLVGLPGLHPRPCWVLLQLFSPNICKRNLIYRGHEKMTPRVLELLGRWVLGVATEAAGLPSSFCTVKSRGCAVQWDPPCPTTTGQKGKPGSRASLREAGGHVRSGPSPPCGAWSQRTETVVTPRTLLFHVSNWTWSSREWKPKNGLWSVAKRYPASRSWRGDGSVLRG